MAGSCVITAGTDARYKDSGLREVVLTWTAHTDGAVLITENTGAFALSGYVSNMETTPDGVSVPTAYTATLKKANGAVLATKANASTSTPELTEVGWHIINSALKLTISGAGSGAKGVVRVIVRTP